MDTNNQLSPNDVDAELPEPPIALPRANLTPRILVLLWGLRILVVVLSVIVVWNFFASLGHPSPLP